MTPIAEIFSLSILAALLQQTSLTLAESVTSARILAEEGQLCICTRVYMRWVKVLPTGEGQIEDSSFQSLGKHPKLSFSLMQCSCFGIYVHGLQPVENIWV